MAKYKYILTAIITLCAITTFAQPAQYTPMTAAGYQMKRLKVDSTLHLPSFCGVPTIRGSVAKEGALAIDTCGKYLYMWTRAAGWDTVNTSGGGGSSTDTTSLSNRINLKIDSLKRISDSVFAYRNGTRVFQFKDSVGGGGTTPNLQQVLDVGATAYNKNVYFYDTTNGGGLIDFINFNFQKFGSSDYMEIKHNDNYSRNLAERIYFQSGGASISIGQNFDIGSQQDAFMSIGFNDYSQSASGFHKLKSGSSFNTPFTTTIPPVTGTLAMSVNNQTADANGNITISTSGVAVDTIFRTIGKDSIFYKKNNITYAIKDSVGTNPAPVGYYGAFQDTTTQTAALINTAYGVKLGVTDLSNGVTISNNSRIKIANAGIYNIQFSLQLEKTGSGNMIADIWLRKNGVNLNGTTGKVVLTGSANASPIVAAWNYLVAVSSNDSLELMWSTSNDNVVIKAAPATSPHPSIPSAILTVTQQSGIMAGTGISPLDTANMLLPYLRKADTTVFQRKSLSANTIMANNTSGTANATAQIFKKFGNQTYSDSITITGASTPSGATNHSFRWSQIGNLVTLHITLTYATTGSLSQVAIEIPDGLPAPILPTGLSANNEIIAYGTGFLTNNTTVLSTVFSKVFLRQNTGLTNDYEVVINQSTNGTYRVMNATIQYFAQ